MKARLADHDSGSSLIHSTTGRGNCCEDIRETALQTDRKSGTNFGMKRRPNHDANALLIALAVLLACLFYLMGELKFWCRTNGLFFINTGACFSRGSESSS